MRVEFYYFVRIIGPEGAITHQKLNSETYREATVEAAIMRENGTNVDGLHPVALLPTESGTGRILSQWEMDNFHRLRD